MQISIKHNITEFYVAFTNRLIVIGIIAIITELMFVGFSNFSFSRDERNVEFINYSHPQGKECNTQIIKMTWPGSHKLVAARV